MEFSQAPILVGGMLSEPSYHSEGKIINIQPEDVAKDIKRLELHFQHDNRAGKELAIHFRSSLRPLNRQYSSNFEKDRFAMLLSHFLDNRALKTPIEYHFDIEVISLKDSEVPLPSEEIMRKEVVLVDGKLEEMDEETFYRQPESIIEGTRNLAKIQDTYEYIPLLAYSITSPLEEFEGTNTHAMVSVKCCFPYSDCWKLEVDLRVDIPSRSPSGFISSAVEILNKFPEAAVVEKRTMTSERLKEITENFAASQYRMKLIYITNPNAEARLFDRMEVGLSPVLHSGRKRDLKEKTFKRGYNMSLVWAYYKPFLMDAAPAVAKRIEREFIMNTLYLARFFSPIRTGSKGMLVKVYKEADDFHHIATPKIDGTRTWLYIIITPSDTMRVVEAGGDLTEEKNWALDPVRAKKIRDCAKASKSETLVSIYDSEKVSDRHYVFDLVVSVNKNHINAPLSNRWSEIHSDVTKEIFSFLNEKGMHVQESYPVAITKKNFKEEFLKMFDKTRYGFPCDGIVLSPTSAPYYPYGKTQRQFINIRFKPGEDNTFDFLMKHIERESLVPFGIEIPKKGVPYVGYVGATRDFIDNIPRQEARTHIWQARHFPAMVRNPDRAILIPCPFVTSILPTSHIVIGEEGEDYDDTIVECSYRDGFMRPHRRRDDKTIEYKSGAIHYGNTYEKAFELLPAILDPIDKKTIEKIEDEASDYYDTSQNLARHYYKSFTDGCALGKAIVYGKYFRTLLSMDGRESRGTYQVNTGVIIELSAGRGSDTPRALCAGATEIYAIDPDVNGLITLEGKARGARLLYSPDEAMRNKRKGMGLEDPIIYSSCKFPRAFNLRCIVGSFDGARGHLDMLDKLRIDSRFPQTGVPVVSNQFAIHYALQDLAGATAYKFFIDSVLRVEGILGVSYYDGSLIEKLFEKEFPPSPWKKSENGVELLFSDTDRAGKRKYYIEKRWNAKSPERFGRHIGIFLPTISAGILDEPLVHRDDLERLFYEDYDILYSGPMFDLPEYADEQRTRQGAKGNLQDMFTSEDYAYLSLVNIFLVSKKKKRAKRAVKFS